MVARVGEQTVPPVCRSSIATEPGASLHALMRGVTAVPFAKRKSCHPMSSPSMKRKEGCAPGASAADGVTQDSAAATSNATGESRTGLMMMTSSLSATQRGAPRTTTKALSRDRKHKLYKMRDTCGEEWCATRCVQICEFVPSALLRRAIASSI